MYTLSFRSTILVVLALAAAPLAWMGCSSPASTTSGSTGGTASTGSSSGGGGSTSSSSSSGSTSSGAMMCTAEETRCGTTCTDTKADPANCGKCNKKCPMLDVCTDGVCTPCPDQTVVCGNSCVDPFTDNANCGKCGEACTGKLTCSVGVCNPPCDAPTIPCNGGCVNPKANKDNCGACGNVCPSGQVCSDGVCLTDCWDGLTKCGAACVDTMNDGQNCGACGMACTGNTVCSGGKCVAACAGNTVSCGGSCVDVVTDPNNCGVCGNQCALTDDCVGGSCEPKTLKTWTGVMNDVSIGDLDGWTQCYVGTYGQGGVQLATILAPCNGDRMLVGCRPAGSTKLRVAAQAQKTDVLFDTGAMPATTHTANGVAWYYSPVFSWGFAPEGDTVALDNCDKSATTMMPGADGNQRVCWNTLGHNLNSGNRCGDQVNQFTGSAWERLLFTATTKP